MGETIVQPGLIDDNCAPYGQPGAAITPVGTLTGWLSLKSSATNADAAIAAVNSGAVSTAGNILELGALQSNGTLAAAPPGISSTGGKGESATLNMSVAKSGRTTGLTCAGISAVNLDVSVDYYTDCAETKPYLTKVYTNQIAISGNQFSDAGDSGSLVVDSSNAEPVGLFFAGGVNTSGVSEGVANPVADVLSELSTQVGGGTSYTFVGTTDHAVSCLNYGNVTVKSAQARVLSDAQTAQRAECIGTGADAGESGDGNSGRGGGQEQRSSRRRRGDSLRGREHEREHACHGEWSAHDCGSDYGARGGVGIGAANGLRGQRGAGAGGYALLSQAVAAKQQIAQSLMQQNPAFFGVGVGQSFDNPQEAALVIYVDRRMVPAQLPAIVDGLRARYVVMDRLHVTRSYAGEVQRRSRCMARTEQNTELLNVGRPQGLQLH